MTRTRPADIGTRSATTSAIHRAGVVADTSPLAAAATTPTESRFKDVGQAAVHLVRRRPLALATALVLELVWVALAIRFPTLLLFASGLVPAGIVWYVVARPTSRDHA